MAKRAMAVMLLAALLTWFAGSMPAMATDLYSTKVTVTANSVNRRVELTVSDEGPGIPQRVQGRIFERFYTAETGDGSGLGLAIARELAQRMRGRISITSNKRFTAFTLDLPPAELPAPAPRAEARA